MSGQTYEDLPWTSSTGLCGMELHRAGTRAHQTTTPLELQKVGQNSETQCNGSKVVVVVVRKFYYLILFVLRCLHLHETISSMAMRALKCRSDGGGRVFWYCCGS